MTDKKKPATKIAPTLQSAMETNSAPANQSAAPEPISEDLPTSDEAPEIEFWIDAVHKGDEDNIQKSVASELSSILKKHGLENYTTLFLKDQDSISDYHLDRLYEAASTVKKDRNILLIIHSDGGSIEPAYLISKSLKYFAKEKFVVAVPRRAKSAATLICLGATEIHMGITSQLGPIDPQIGGFPALGLVNALDTLAGLASRFPEASKMLSEYLESKLDLRTLGYFNRVTESAVQYGERLLMGKKLPQTPQYIANHLVNHYKDHGFVIDIDEAKTLLGETIIKAETKEYAAANEIIQFFDFFHFVLRKSQKKSFWYCGNVQHGMTLFPLK